MQSRSDLDLAETQRWMQAFVIAPDVVGEQVEQANAIVLPSDRLASVERVGIYRDMYLARLVEALAADYPGVLHRVGREDFDRLAARYIEAFPSRSYTLNRLGDRFPEFIATQDAFLHELARLELALTEVFDEKETPALSPEAIAAVPPEAWEHAALKPVSAFRLLAFRYPVSEYLGALAGENPFPSNRRRNTWIVAYRKNYAVHRLRLTRQAFDLLTALAAGTPVGKAVASSPPKRVFEWFREWTAAGLFESVSLCN